MLKRVPNPPAGIDERAGQEWRRLAALAHAQRTLTEGDLPALRLLCETLGTAAQAQEVIAQEGLTVAGERGHRAHPAVKILESARAQAMRLLIEFGLTPRARGHVEPVASLPGSNPFEEIG